MFQAEVEDLHENYIRPQENGSHYHRRYVSGNEKYRLLAEADNYLDFNVSDYTVEELAGKGIILNWNRRLVPYCRWMRG